jgi:hypothetical protein
MGYHMAKGNRPVCLRDAVVDHRIGRTQTHEGFTAVIFLQASIISKSNFLGLCAIDNGAFLVDVFSKYWI